MTEASEKRAATLIAIGMLIAMGSLLFVPTLVSIANASSSSLTSESDWVRARVPLLWVLGAMALGALLIGLGARELARKP